jgi:hypothetical protein
MQVYPWYATTEGDEIEQGDFFEACPVYIPSAEATGHGIVDFEWEERDLVVLSQTCDLVKGREKVSEVLLCSVWNRSELTTGHLSTPKGLEDARRGNLPGFHLLASCELPGIKRELRVVDFRRVYSLPVQFLRRKALFDQPRLRLLPPYREHLSQAFARFFMRVGLPVDIRLD